MLRPLGQGAPAALIPWNTGTAGRLFSIGWLERLLISSRAVWFYAAKLLWPANPTFSYPRWIINPANLLAYACLVAGAALTVGIVLARKR